MASRHECHQRHPKKHQAPWKALDFKGFPGCFCINLARVLDLAFVSGAFFTRRAQALAQPAFHLTFAFLENLRETMSERAGEVE